MEIRFKISSIRYYRSWKWNRSKLDRERIYLDVSRRARGRDICIESLMLFRRAKSWGETFFFSFFFASRTSFSRNADCVDLEPGRRLFMTVLDFPNEREERRERGSGDSQSAYHRIDISMFPHGHGASPPWSITTGPRLLDQGFVCRRRASSVFSPFPAVHSFSTLRIPRGARFTTS